MLGIRSTVKCLTDEQLVDVQEKAQDNIAYFTNKRLMSLVPEQRRIFRACEKEILSRVKHQRWAQKKVS